MLVCLKCGCAEMTVAETEVGTFNNPIQPIPVPFAYKKLNHFRDWLARSQAKENTTIPTVVYDSLLNELKNLRVASAEQVTGEL